MLQLKLTVLLIARFLGVYIRHLSELFKQKVWNILNTSSLFKGK